MISHNAEDLVDALYKEIARQNAEIELLQAEIAVYVRYILANDSVSDVDEAAGLAHPAARRDGG
jgi:hypothetical protein